MIPDPVIALMVQDNLDLACSAIEKAAMERAVADIDEGFISSYEQRRRGVVSDNRSFFVLY